jgi:hypothetical protein
MFAGKYTRDTAYIVSPFKNEWLSIPRVPISVAKKILPMLNRMDRVAGLDFGILGPASLHWPHSKEFDTAIYNQRAIETGDDQNVLAIDATSDKLTKGYVTWDDLGNDGDDVVHEPWPYFLVPNAIQSSQNVDESTQTVDVIFFDFMKPFIDQILIELDQQHLSTLTQWYSNRLITELIPQYLSRLPGNGQCCSSSSL